MHLVWFGFLKVEAPGGESRCGRGSQAPGHRGLPKPTRAEIYWEALKDFEQEFQDHIYVLERL